MRYVYVLRSVSNRGKTYVGVTGDLKRRVRDHNAGRGVYTAGFRPWALQSYVAFEDHEKAKKFERYLKQGTGKAFMRKWFL